MTSQASYYRKSTRARRNAAMRAQPYRFPHHLLTTEWPSQLTPRNQRFSEDLVAPGGNDTTENDDNPLQSSLPPAMNSGSHLEVPHQSESDQILHLQLQLSEPNEVANACPPTNRSSRSSSVLQAPVQLNYSAALDIFLPPARDLTEATVGTFVNQLDIPKGFYEFWSIIRQFKGSNIMMDKLLHWFREQQLQLTREISQQCLPEKFRYPLDYRAAQKKLQLSSAFHVDMFLCCKTCRQWKPRSIFEKPFNVRCCNLLPRLYDTHFVVYQIHEILQLILPYYKPRVKQGYYNGWSRLEEMRNNVNGTEDDIYVSIGYDGVPFSPSSGISVYPVLGTIDGLSGRHTKGSTFVIALWIGSLTTSKPDIGPVFAPIMAQFKTLATTPMTWMDYEGRTRKSRVFVSTCLTDTIARPQMMCLTQFNGIFGCSWCLQQRDSKKMWDYQPNCRQEARTNQDLRRRMEALYQLFGDNPQADNDKNYGIQGRTPLADLDYFDIVKDFPPCTMHANYEGVAKHLTEFWTKFSEPLILSESRQDEIDEFLMSCKPPNRVTRPPRQLSNLKKAHEFCIWLFYTSPVVLQEHLPVRMYNHYLSLVRGLSLLHKESPSSHDISSAEYQLTRFLTDYSNHYGVCNGRYNIHILQHLCDFVRERGPLYTYSLMPMESYNKHIKELPTGPKYVTTQICTRFLEETVFKSEKLSRPQQPPSLEFQGEDHKIISTCKVITTKQYVESNYGINCTYFQRLRRDRRIYHSYSYKAVTTTNSSCYKIGHGLYFDVQLFVKNPAGYLAIGKQLQGQMFKGLFYLFQCKESHAITSMSPSDLGSVVFKMKYKNTLYVAEFLNDFESYAE